MHHLNRELLAERTKVKALGEELENPLNVHRCADVCVFVCARARANSRAPPSHCRAFVRGWGGGGWGGARVAVHAGWGKPSHAVGCTGML